MSNFRNDTWCKSETYCTCIVFCKLCSSKNSVKVAAFVSFCASSFKHEVDTSYTTTCIWVCMRVNVVSTNDALTYDIVHITKICSHIECHDIACVVSVKIKNTSASFYFFRDVVNLFWRWRLEYTANTTSVDETVTNVSEEQRKMSGTATCDDTNFSFRDVFCFYYTWV